MKLPPANTVEVHSTTDTVQTSYSEKVLAVVVGQAIFEAIFCRRENLVVHDGVLDLPAGTGPI